MSLLRSVVSNTEVADELLGELDKAARRVDMEYGLPIHGDDVSTLREILYKWVAKHFGDR